VTRARDPRLENTDYLTRLDERTEFEISQRSLKGWSCNALYGGPRKKRFPLPFLEKRGFSAKTLPKINSINLIDAFNANISSI
jgi:hypothetical protein